MYLWSTNLCILLGAVTWCLHFYSFFGPGKCRIVPEMTTPTHTLFNSLFTDHSTIQCYVVLATDSVGKWTINTDKKLSHTNFFENESNKVLLTIQLYHNCSNALHEIKIDRCFKHCWEVCTCNANTHTFQINNEGQKSYARMSMVQYVKLKLKFRTSFALD
jgi:hypothetical protein